MKPDIEIAQEMEMKPIEKIASKIGLTSDDLELYGKYKAKISKNVSRRVKNNKDGKLILVTAINPTPAGEGKTTTSVGLSDALSKIGKKTIVCLREPSLGPSFGVKGGAAGGGYSQIVPMEDINLHFTGDIHAVTTAHNLLAAMIDNSIQQGNPLNIDPRQIVFRRVVDLNDRALRNCIIGLGGKSNGVPRETGFDISVASEIMAILCLSKDLEDMKTRFSNIVVAYTYDKKPIIAKDLEAEGAMALIMKDAIKPNLVQTLEKTPALIHGGPFANIAHGCNSLSATKMALKLGDYVVTEAGFGADLGGEKFMNLKCRLGNIKPDAVVVVATIRALKMHGGVLKENLKTENLSALERGFENLKRHIENMKKFGVSVVVAINKFDSDTHEEIKLISDLIANEDVPFALSEVFEKGGTGGVDLATKVVDTIENANLNFKLIYKDEDSIEEKANKVAKAIYGASSVVFSQDALKMLDKINSNGYGKLPICFAKTQYSFSDNPEKLGAPSGFEINVREVRLSAGAGFIVLIAGEVMTMPGLPKRPSACNINIDDNEKIVGLF